MAKILYLIPGFGENTKQKRYFDVQNILRKQGFKIIPIKISWKNKVMDDYVKDFFDQYKQHDDKDKIYLFGFSFGAMISLIASTIIKIKAQFLCSLSPYFKEDLPLIKEWRKKSIGIRRVKNFSLLSFNDLAEKIRCKTYIFYGTKEGPEVERRAKIASKKIINNELFVIKGAKHDIGQDLYINKISDIISKI